jgi:precorrin isomerase
VRGELTTTASANVFVHWGLQFLWRGAPVMTDNQQIALAIAPTVLPTLTVLVGILVSNRQIDALRQEMNARFDASSSLFTEQLRRVEQVLDARLKHLEER